ncbi:MAG: lipopolysaccharide assembly protein LapA domain-containing protein [Solibacillus sp.]
MKMQSGLVFGLIFAMVNMESVPVNYVFGEAMWPLVLIIFGAALVGALISVSFATMKMFSLQRQVSTANKQVDEQQHILNEKDSEILRLRTELEEGDTIRYNERDVADEYGPYSNKENW